MLEATQEPGSEPVDGDRAAAEAKASADVGDYDAARAAMSRAIDGNPNDSSLHALMAWYTFQCNAVPAFERQRLAEHHLSVALELDPSNAQAHYYQGMIWAGGGNVTRARISLSAALNVRPDFQAAAQALDRLGKAEITAVTKENERPAQMRRGRRSLVLPLVLATVVMALGGGAILYFPGTGAQNAAADLARQLGTRLVLVSASRAGQDLHIDAGSSWETMPAGERTDEMRTIAKNAQLMGVTNVFVYANSAPVAESHGANVCVGKCAATPAIEHSSQGSHVQMQVETPH